MGGRRRWENVSITRKLADNVRREVLLAIDAFFVSATRSRCRCQIELSERREALRHESDAARAVWWLRARRPHFSLQSALSVLSLAMVRNQGNSHKTPSYRRDYRACRLVETVYTDTVRGLRLSPVVQEPTAIFGPLIHFLNPIAISSLAEADN
jgi:hypothetical protein